MRSAEEIRADFYLRGLVPIEELLADRERLREVLEAIRDVHPDDCDCPLFHCQRARAYFKGRGDASR